MKTVIVGCGRVGAELASTFDKAGHEVIILDLTPRAFDRLPSTFKGTALRGDGTDEDILRRAGAEDADIFIAMTEGDNRNVLAAQLAPEALGAKRVIAKINDPVRAEAYADLGIAALCRTNLMTDAVNTFLGLPASGRVGILPPTGSHPGGEHHDLAASAGPLVSADRPAPREASAAAAGGSGGQRSATTPSGQSAGPAGEV